MVRKWVKHFTWERICKCAWWDRKYASLCFGKNRQFMISNCFVSFHRFQKLFCKKLWQTVITVRSYAVLTEMLSQAPRNKPLCNALPFLTWYNHDSDYFLNSYHHCWWGIGASHCNGIKTIVYTVEIYHHISGKKTDTEANSFNLEDNVYLYVRQ